MSQWIEINKKTKMIVDDTSIQLSQLDDWRGKSESYTSIYLNKKDIIKILEKLLEEKENA
jgi:predicted kinase